MSRTYTTYANGSRTEFFDTFEDYHSTISSVTTESGEFSSHLVRTDFDYNGKAIPASENEKGKLNPFKAVSILVFAICVVATFFLTNAGDALNSASSISSEVTVSLPIIRFVFAAIGIASILAMKHSKFRAERN